MKKLSETQIEIIKLMREGWQMGVSLAGSSRIWIQKDGVGRGGETKKVTSPVYNGLKERGVLECVDNDFPTAKYNLNELGKTCKI